ncbi:hypothetical protein QQZ08_005277 [Neonectria magnoliae]|uniref:Apple domain-containing protein n=1 Tax=Neonectria magnoliae TaxID=2732573 RepID=A0ABR1I4C8_9HYPO
MSTRVITSFMALALAGVNAGLYKPASGPTTCNVYRAIPAASRTCGDVVGGANGADYLLAAVGAEMALDDCRQLCVENAEFILYQYNFHNCNVFSARFDTVGISAIESESIFYDVECVPCQMSRTQE